LVLPFTANISDATIFSWKDENEITHFTDSPEQIPSKYRDRKIEGLRIIEEVPFEESPNSNSKINLPITRLNHLQEYKVPLISTNSGNFIVDTTINGKVKVKLMLDTGASLMSLSPEVCRKLGIKETSNLPAIQMQTANGISQNKLIALDKVKIGDAEVDLVEASIGKKMLGIGGLLGMSFLSNFRMEINHTESELILKPLAKPGEQVWGGKPVFWWKSKFKYYNSQINGYKLKAMHTKTLSNQESEAVTKVVRFYEDLHKKLTRRASFFGLPKI
jgi:clan AA aspartic protease (TIGR02281 family)